MDRTFYNLRGGKLALTPSQKGKRGSGKLKLILSAHTSREI